MEILILGPVEVRDARGEVALGGPKPRAVLAVLALHANAPVSAERLALALWGEDAPARAVKTVQVHVARLRKALDDPGRLETAPGGYRLRVGPGELDLERFERLTADARHAGEPEVTASLLRKALALWRGDPLGGLEDEPFAPAEIAKLEERRLSALEARIDADLALGREAELVSELPMLIAAHPARERLVEQLLLALYRCGRQSEALAAYRAARTRLIEAAGVEPGPELQRLHAAILRQDRSLLGRRTLELPRELERATAVALEGREVELGWLRERWERASAGAGALVTLGGEAGIGKSRLAAEFAAEAHARGATVLYVDGSGPPAAALAVLERARSTSGPTLLVVDDADHARAEVRDALQGAVNGGPRMALVLDPTGTDLVLAPLDVGAVHAIVTRYAPESDGQEPPAEWLLGATRGVPKLVHEVARDWARRRVETGAEETAARRADLAARERALAADVELLEAARDQPAPPDGAQVCPFKGLASFQVADAPYFFGRERLVAELVARLVGAPLIAIVGDSGSGKSSVLRAGLLPALAAGVLPGSARRPQLLIRPGDHPLAELRELPRGAVLAVDQFEETFTACTDEAERTAFVAALVAHAREGQVALAMRADFYGRCAAYPELSRMLSASHVLVSAMSADELRRAVVGPAQRAGLIVDPELVDALVADVEGEPGALPLLSTALLELWQRRDGRRLRLGAYERAGGVRGAVARLGEDAYAALSAAQQPIARHVLLALATVDERRVERRRVPPAELGAPEVIELLADRRLLTVHAGSVELAHEALLREWPRLQGWIDEDRDTLRVLGRVRAEAREWQRLERDEGALLRGAPLAEARLWLEPEQLAAAEREFLTASLEREQRERRARRRRFEVIVGALATGLVAITAVALVAIDQRREAERTRNIARSQALALQSAQALETDPQLAVRLAMAADQLKPTAQSTSALRQAVLADRQVGQLPSDPLTAETAAFDPLGTRVVTGGDTGVATVWDARTRKRLGRLDQNAGKLMAARFSPDGSRIALAFDSAVVVTDASLGTPRVVFRPEKGMSVSDVAFGSELAIGLKETVNYTGRVAVVSPEGALLRTLRTADDDAIDGLDIDGSGRVAAADDNGGVHVWNADGTRLDLISAAKSERDARFSPDGKLVLAVGEDGYARLFDARTGKPVKDVRVGPRKLTAAAFSQDGKRFATAGYDGAVRVFDTAGGSQLLVLRGQLARVLDVGFGPTSDRLVSAGDDGTAKLWNAGGMRTIDIGAADIEFSPDGGSLAAGADDATARIWNVASGRVIARLPGHDGDDYVPTRYSPVGNDLVVGRWIGSTIDLWTPPTSKRIVTVPGDPGVNSTRFGPDGKRIIYSYAGGHVVVHDVATGRELQLRGAPADDDVEDIGLSPDGRHAAGALASGAILVWRLDRPGRVERVLRGHQGDIDTLDYAPDGRLLSAGADRTIRVWNTATGRSVVLRGHSDEVTTAIFTTDGRYVLSTSSDGTLRVWEPRGGAALVVLQSSETPLVDVTEARNGLIATLDENDVVKIFRCPVCGSVASVRAQAAALHPRPLSAAERARFLSDAG